MHNHRYDGIKNNGAQNNKFQLFPHRDAAPSPFITGMVIMAFILPLFILNGCHIANDDNAITTGNNKETPIPKETPVQKNGVFPPMQITSHSPENITQDHAVKPARSTDLQKAFTVKTYARFNEPWAMARLPDGGLLITEKGGALYHLSTDFQRTQIMGVPMTDAGGQGGFADITLSPAFIEDGILYLGFVEGGKNNRRGGAVGKGRLILSRTENGKTAAHIEEFKTIWRQEPKTTGRGHFSLKLAFSTDGDTLFISSGERQEFDPAQDGMSNLGKIIRLNPDGSIPNDNPFLNDKKIRNDIWSFGHRNILGLAFDPSGQLWNHEMGPKNGDELNIIQKGANYGYPLVSNGKHYDGSPIPDHATRPDFIAPHIWWKQTIAPSSMLFSSALGGDLFITGLASQSLIRLKWVKGAGYREAARYDAGARLREVKGDGKGGLWLLTDGPRGALLHISAQ